MIKFRHEIFITLIVTMCMVTAENRYYASKSVLRGGNPDLLDILLRGNPMSILRNGNPEISTVLHGSPKTILIGNPAATLHRDNLNSVLYPGIPDVLPELPGKTKLIVPIGNPALAAMLRNNPRARIANTDISAMLRNDPNPFLLAAHPEIPAMPRDNPKPILIADMPISALRGNPKRNIRGGNIKLLAMLHELQKPLNIPVMLRVRKDSVTDNNVFPTADNNKYIINDKDLKNTFNKMIESVTKANEERIQSLKKLLELENYQPQVSRTSQPKDPLIAIIMNTPYFKTKYDNLNVNQVVEDQHNVIFKRKHKHKEPSLNNILKELIEGFDDDEANISQAADDTYLRSWKGCNKSAASSCTKACKKAFKEICNDYMCSKKLKSDGKKQCKKLCKHEFASN